MFWHEKLPIPIDLDNRLHIRKQDKLRKRHLLYRWDKLQLCGYYFTIGIDGAKGWKGRSALLWEKNQEMKKRKRYETKSNIHSLTLNWLFINKIWKGIVWDNSFADIICIYLFTYLIGFGVYSNTFTIYTFY